MAAVHVTKVAAAQRQIDAAIRMLFAGEDALAVHILVAAGHTILVDLDGRRDRPVLNDVYSTALEKVVEVLKLPHAGKADLDQNLPAFKELVQRVRRKPANFLKHANRDPEHALDEGTLKTDHLLEACTLFGELGLKITPEMYVYARWHLAVYPHEESDKIKTEIGYVHDLVRDVQLELGKFLLDQAKRKALRDEL